MKLSTLMAIMSAAGMGATQKDSLASALEKPMHQVRVVATQFEMKTLQTAVTSELIAENMHAVERDFSAFVRSVSHSNAKDVSKDHWGTSYELQKTEEGYSIVSAGPDMNFDTDDDIIATVRTR